MWKSKYFLDRFGSDSESELIEEFGELEDFIDDAETKLNIGLSTIISVLTHDVLYAKEGTFAIKGIKKKHGRYAVITKEKSAETYWLEDEGVRWFVEEDKFKFFSSLEKAFDREFNRSNEANRNGEATKLKFKKHWAKVPKLNVGAFASYKSNTKEGKE